ETQHALSKVFGSTPMNKQLRPDLNEIPEPTVEFYGKAYSTQLKKDLLNNCCEITVSQISGGWLCAK
ncbi:hypothetical protein O5408_25655, partial [Escherichia coli]|nr:hypothetical protein [Escherichia coli]